MLLEHEKDGVGSKRMSRASAFLEAAAEIDCMARVGASKPVTAALIRAADRMRDMAVRERRAHDAERAAERLSKLEA